MRRLPLAVLAASFVVAPHLAPAGAQGRVGRDSATRVTRYVRDLGYGAVEGLLFAGVDQLRNDPEFAAKYPEAKGWDPKTIVIS